MENNQNKKTKRRSSPYKRNRRLQGKYLSWLLIGCIVLCLAAGFVVKDREFSDSENRRLAQWPEFSLSALADGSYFGDISTWFSDTFPGRESWLELADHVSSLHGYSTISFSPDFVVAAPNATEPSVDDSAGSTAPAAAPRSVPSDQPI